MATFTHALQTGNYGESKFIISSNPALGTHVTISAALAVASSGDTIFIRDGAYTEDLTMVPGVRLTAYRGIRGESVTITGKMTFSAAGNYFISNLNFVTNADFIIDLIGANAIVVAVQDCTFNAADNTIINYTNSNASTNLVFDGCSHIVTDAASTVFVKTGIGNMSFDEGSLINTAGSVVASTTSGGTLGLNYQGITVPISMTGTALISSSFCTYNTNDINTTALTVSTGAVAGFVYHSFIGSGTASAVDIGAGTTFELDACEINSSNANVITGAGTLERGDLTFISGFTINPTTDTQLPRLPKVSPTQQTFTTGVAATYTTPANCQWIRIRMVGGGGGGGGSGTGATNGATGTASTFSGGGLTASPGTGTLSGGAAAGGNIANIRGSSGTYTSNTIASVFGGTGGSSYFGGSGTGGNNAPSVGTAGVFGAGGGGAGCAATVGAGLGGGAAGYVEHVINLPTATYTYTVGTGGAAGAAGTGGAAGGVGGDGYIIVEEYYL